MPRNVLIIVLDDIGAEKLAAYSPPTPAPPTPHFDALVKKGVLFFRAYSGPLCGPTRSAIQTGRYSFRTGFGTNITDVDKPPSAYHLPTTEMCLPRMVNAGRPPAERYATGAFGKWHMTYNTGDDKHPNQCGWDYFAGCMTNDFGVGNGTGHFDWRRVVNGRSQFVTAPPFDTTIWSASVVGRDALEWIGKQASPWLAYVAFNPPHAPFTIPPFDLVSAGTQAKLTSMGMSPGDSFPDSVPLAQRVAAFDAMIEAADTELHKLIKGAVDANTIVIVLGDNGTPGDVILPPFVPQHAKRSLFEQGIRVPMLAFGAGVASPGRKTDALVHAVDVWRTVAEITGAVVSTPAAGRDSISFLPLLENATARSARSRVFSESFKPNGFEPHMIQQHTLMDEEYKLLDVDGTERFYHLSVDPLETNDLIQSGMTPKQQVMLDVLRMELAALLAS